MNLSINQPSIKQVNFYLEQWENLEKYQDHEKSLHRLFHQYSPNNVDLKDILLKVSVLNDFYSTNILDTWSVAKHIQSLKVDDRLRRRDLSLVNEIATVSINNREIRHYSFATKYCSHHYSEAYPIYDNYVSKMLYHFSKIDKFDKFSRNDLRNYERFFEIINKFRKYYKLENYSIRQIDIYLWLLGKEKFPNRYPRKN
ncbi:hypothetical protein [Acinetobacter guillouiae]|uniref:hypothetical protein n=1 Tax=Acinetobacter guillouiae TaxID=106649 RepID=UPI001CD1E42C|nr:hypothetical protein [Acinetobacter guillouiae]